MSKYRKRKKKTELPPIDWDVEDLKWASWHYWKGDYPKAGKLLGDLMRRLIKEPLKDTEEYKNGQGKQAAPVEEPQEEEPDEKRTVTFEDLFSAGETDAGTSQPKRDSSGYIIEEDTDDLLIR